MGYIIHHDDADGWLSAAILQARNPTYTPITFNYTTGIDNIAFSGEDIILVDISFNTPMLSILMDLKSCCNSITWIDHHYTSYRFIREHRDKLSNIRYNIQSDTGSCAEVIYRDTANFRNVAGLPFVIKLMSIADRWNPTDNLWGYYLEEGIMQCKSYKELVTLANDDIDCFTKIIGLGKDHLSKKIANIPSLNAPKNYIATGLPFVLADTWDYPLIELKKISPNVGYIFNDNYLVVISKDEDLYSKFSPHGGGGHKHVVGIKLDATTRDLIGLREG